MGTLGVDPANKDAFMDVEDALYDAVPPITKIREVAAEYRENAGKIASERYETRIKGLRGVFSKQLMDPNEARKVLDNDPFHPIATISALMPILDKEDQAAIVDALQHDADAMAMIDTETLYTPPLTSDKDPDIKAHAVRVERMRKRIPELTETLRFGEYARIIMPRMLQRMVEMQQRLGSKSKAGAVPAGGSSTPPNDKTLSKEERLERFDEVADEY